MTYEETIELEENIKIKNKADQLYSDFLEYVKLDVKNLKSGNRFLYWSDQHNATYFSIKEGNFVFECRFLHESYDVSVTPSGIFGAIKNKNRGIDHLQSAINALKKL